MQCVGFKVDDNGILQRCGDKTVYRAVAQLAVSSSGKDNLKYEICPNHLRSDISVTLASGFRSVTISLID